MLDVTHFNAASPCRQCPRKAYLAYFYVGSEKGMASLAMKSDDVTIKHVHSEKHSDVNRRVVVVFKDVVFGIGGRDCLKLYADLQIILLIIWRAVSSEIYVYLGIPVNCLNLDQFSLKLDSSQSELVNNAKYRGLLVNDDLSWDDHILQLCKSMNYYVHVLRMLNKIFPKQLLLRVYKFYIQSKLDYGLSIWISTTEGNLDRVQRIQNFCAMIICKNYDNINTRGIDLVESLGMQTISQRRDYFLSALMFKCIHGLAPHYLCNDVTMIADIHDYNTRSSGNRNLYVPKCNKELCKRSFAYQGSTLWNDLPDEVK